MKRVFSLIIVVAMLFSFVTVLAACKDNKTCVHIDSDKDGKCDLCGEDVDVHVHVDADKDCKCDTCSAQLEHKDEDADDKCDVCGTELAHHDADHDCVCDYCHMQLAHNFVDNVCTVCGAIQCDHVDENADCKCDKCEAVFHTDDNRDCKCDNCGQQIAHVDANGDAHCDVCNTLLPHSHVYNDNEVCDLCGEPGPNHKHVNKNNVFYKENRGEDTTNCDQLCDTCGFDFSVNDYCSGAGHTDDDGDKLCDFCGATLGRQQKEIIKVTLSSTTQNKKIITNMETYFNENYASKDGYSVKITHNGNVAASASTTLATGTADICELNDKVVKGIILSGYALPLNQHVQGGRLNLEGLYASSVDRFRLNTTTGDVGGNEELYAVPINNEPTAIFYNATALKNAGIHIISVPEKDIAAYNAKNSTNYVAHGYYEYTTSPDGSATQQTTINGKTAYRVFNDCIPMSWEELRTVSEYFTRSYNSSSVTKFGYYSEWWFNYGWSVGGDCLENGADGKLKFTLCDTTANYLVTKNITVNGTAYTAGELLGYVDKLYVAGLSETPDGLYEIPSQYDAFAEFCALSQQKGVKVTDDGSVTGYGISPNPNDLASSSRTSTLTSKLCAFTAMGIDEAGSLKKSMEVAGLEWGICPFAQYREYNSDGSIKVVDGTEVKGLEVCHNLQSAMAISSKVTSSRKVNQCLKFINWWISEEAQTMLVQSGITLSCRASVNENADVQQIMKTAIGCENIAPVVTIANAAMQGDWSYVEDGDWITAWANCLNTDVRNGVKTIDAFWKEYQQSTTDLLSAYSTKKYR